MWTPAPGWAQSLIHNPGKVPIPRLGSAKTEGHTDKWELERLESLMGKRCPLVSYRGTAYQQASGILQRRGVIWHLEMIQMGKLRPRSIQGLNPGHFLENEVGFWWRMKQALFPPLY